MEPQSIDDQEQQTQQQGSQQNLPPCSFTKGEAGDSESAHGCIVLMIVNP
jgi:hypothetical protein